MRFILNFVDENKAVVFLIGVFTIIAALWAVVSIGGKMTTDKMTETNNGIQYADVIVLDGMTVTGTTVTQFIKEHYGEFTIGIDTTAVTSKTVTGIASNSSFLCTVDSTKGIVSSVIFTKQ